MPTQKIQITKNGAKYTVHHLPKGFWEAWERDKEGMKRMGFSPFKRYDRYCNGEWFVRLYNGEFATKEEIEKYNKILVEEFMNYLPEITTEKQAEFAHKIEKCETIGDAIRLCFSHRRLFDNVDKFLDFADDEMFRESISDDIEL